MGRMGVDGIMHGICPMNIGEVVGTGESEMTTGICSSCYRSRKFPY